MNIFFKTTLKTLAKNKVRTAVTIIGILLSGAMMCAVIVSVSSFFNYLVRRYVYSEGDWHVEFYSAEYEDCDNLQKDSRLDEVACIQKIGYAPLENENDYKPYAFIAGVMPDSLDTLPIHITNGRFPVNDGEILIPEHLATVGALFLSIGDEINLDVGIRRSSKGQILWQDSSFFETVDEESKEEITNTETLAFTVVGFYERPSFENYSSPGYTLITLPMPEKEGVSYDVFCKLKDPKNVYDFTEKSDLNLSYKYNSDYLMALGVVKYSTLQTMIYTLEAIIIFIIALGSVALIYNAFSISVSERTKQFGLLSSIGATKFQLIQSVIFEAFSVSAIGIPLGILSGISGIGVTFSLLGDKIGTFAGFDEPVKLHFSLPVLLFAALLELVIVLISALIPALRASRVSAIDAIRMTRDIKPERKQHSAKLSYRLFGLSGMLAAKYYRRSRKKYRTTVISLAMSVLLFISASSFSLYLIRSANVAFETDGYDIIYSISAPPEKKGDMLETYKKLKGAESVSSGACTATTLMSCELSRSVITDEYVRSAVDYDFDLPSYSCSCALIFVNDEEYYSILEKEHPELQNEGATPGLIYDSFSVFSNSKGKFASFNLLKDPSAPIVLSEYKYVSGYYIDKIENGYVYYVSYEDENDTFTLMESEAVINVKTENTARITAKPYFMVSYAILNVIYPMSAAEKILPQKEDFEQDYTFFFTSNDHTASYASMKEILYSSHLGTSELIDYAEEVENERDFITVITVFAYGFTVLISLISAANVFNTISTNVALRRREMAMLRSIGMDNRAFNKMTCYECLLYGTRALLIGLPASLLATFLIYWGISGGFELDFIFPGVPMLIASVSVFAVVFATMLYAMRKIKKDDVMQALKNENI